MGTHCLELSGEAASRADKPTGRPPSEGNKYNSKYVDVHWTPLYPFGHSLSYTTFSVANLRLDKRSIRLGDSLSVTVDITNTGERVGTDVIQLYTRDESATVTRPVMELKGFQRVLLEPGEMRAVTFTLRPDDLMF